MTTLTDLEARAPVATVAAPPRRVPRPVPAGSPEPLPAWPIQMLLVGYPIWWALGVTPFIVSIAGMVMGVMLLMRRGLKIVPGTIPWFAFVLWVIPCAFAIDSAVRLIGFGQRTANLIAIGIALLYALNARERLTATRIINSITCFWVFVIVGGYLGTLRPGFRLTTPVGLLLPDGITSNPLVYDLVFPPFAEVQQPYGAETAFARPAAPFPYTNGWGCAIAWLTPVAIACILRTRSKAVRGMLAFVLVAAAVPALGTLNRGMFLGLGLAVVYVSVRLLLRGKVLPFLAVTVVGLLAAVGFLVSGLGSGIESRTEVSETNTGRATVYQETFDRTLRSPVIGYGAPRPSETLVISVGTQGFLWTAMFSYGFVGVGLFLWFLWGVVWRTRNPPDTAGLWLHAALVVPCMTIFYYGIDPMLMLSMVLVAAVLLPGGRREPAEPEPAPQ